jgi:hypothetical protein
MAQAKSDAQAKAESQGQRSQPNRGSNPARESSAPGQANPQLDLSQQIKQSAAEWGQISPRTRNAVMEGADEQIIEKYRKYVEDYYRGVSVRGTERQ